MKGAVLLAIVACLLGSAAAAAEGLSTDASFYEIDGDYGSKIVEANPHGEARDVQDGDVTTAGVIQGSCNEWAHTSVRPYMGSRAYTVGCAYLPEITIRSEQHFLQGWRASPDSQRSLSMAVRLGGVSATPAKLGGAWIAQLHGEGLPFILEWVGEPVAKPEQGIPEPGYYLLAGARQDAPVYNRPAQPLARLMPDTWVRLMIQIDLGKGNGECPGAIADDDAFWTVAIMDNATGLWGQPLRYPFMPPGDRLGDDVYAEDVEGTSKKKGACLHPDDQAYNFKIGQYVVNTTNRMDYDNVSYGKRWINITKNHLIGYKKSVLRLPFEETSGGAVQDRSYTWNGGNAGDPISDYDNDGKIVGPVTRIADGVNGRALRFPGTTGSYVKVPIGANVVDDFDVGNYMTVSAWFRTGAQPAENKGLVMIDEFSDTWKLLLYMRGNGIAFGVRHPGTYSRLDHVFPLGQYADNQWHLVTGTYNRFDPNCQRIAPPSTGAYRRFAFNCQRIKLYIDGRKVTGGEGADLPILRGDNQLVVGKYSVQGFFQGDIDDVGLFNYTMTDADVQNLWRKRGAP
jgi:hypothetical protein